MWFKHGMPDVFQGTPDIEFEFSSLEELLSHPLIMRYLNVSGLTFDNYSVKKEDHHVVLMGEYNKHTLWWVIGYIYPATTELALPDWTFIEGKAMENKI